MSTDLSHALRDAVDGPTASGHPTFDTTGLAARVRRRRAVRAGVRGTVGAGAVGAVVLVGGHLARPDAGRPVAAVPGAAPGTCGSSVDALLGTDTPGPVALEVVGTGTGVGTSSSWRVDSATDLGALVGRELVVSTATSELAQDAPPVELDPEGPFLVVVQDGVVVTDPGAPVGARDVELPGDDFSVDGPVLEEVREVDPGGVYAGGEHGARSTETALVRLPLLTCGTASAPGGSPLPAGDYTVYAYRGYSSASGGPGRTVHGPETLRLLGDGAAAAAVPADLPAEVPVVEGRSTQVVELRGTGARWLVIVGVDGTDARLRAERALAAAGFVHPVPGGDETLLPSHGAALAMHDDRYAVELTEQSAEDGGRELVYRIRER